MDAKDIRALHEAYAQIYQPQGLTEEVEIATEYFYEMGLNEDGINILIEELGEEEFVEWVRDINEEYVLDEATRLQSKAAKSNRILIGPKGSKPQSTTKAREKAQGGLRMRTSSSPSSTIRKRAISSAKTQQAPSSPSSSPTQTKSGIGARIGSALSAAGNRARSDFELAKKTAQTVGKAARVGIEAMNRASDTPLAAKARAATHSGVERHEKALKSLGGFLGRTLGASTARRRSKMKNENYEYILSYLLDEGYAKTIESAEAIFNNMGEEWLYDILDEASEWTGRRSLADIPTHVGRGTRVLSPRDFENPDSDEAKAKKERRKKRADRLRFEVR